MVIDLITVATQPYATVAGLAPTVECIFSQGVHLSLNSSSSFETIHPSTAPRLCKSSNVPTSHLASFSGVPLLEEVDGVLERRQNAVQKPIFECSFWFLDCSYMSNDREEWATHCLSHFRGEEPPKSVQCPLCADWSYTSDDGWTVWNYKQEHMSYHHVLGQNLRASRPDYHLFQHLWQKRLIDDRDLKELKGGNHNLTKSPSSFMVTNVRVRPGSRWRRRQSQRPIHGNVPVQPAITGAYNQYDQGRSECDEVMPRSSFIGLGSACEHTRNSAVGTVQRNVLSKANPPQNTAMVAITEAMGVDGITTLSDDFISKTAKGLDTDIMEHHFEDIEVETKLSNIVDLERNTGSIGACRPQLSEHAKNQCLDHAGAAKPVSTLDLGSRAEHAATEVCPYNCGRTSVHGSCDFDLESPGSGTEYSDGTDYPIASPEQNLPGPLAGLLKGQYLDLVLVQFLSGKRKYHPDTVSEQDGSEDSTKTGHGKHRATSPPTTGSSHSHSGKRSRQGPSQNDDENSRDDDNRDNGDGSSQVPASKKDGERKNPLLFACPYVKRYPHRYLKCFSRELWTVSRVKQHLTRGDAHCLRIYCPTCLTELKQEEERDNHIREIRCPKKPQTKPEGITDTQRKQLSKRSSSTKSPEENWNDVYKIMFPGQPLPSSPYIDAALSVELRAFREHVLSNGPRIWNDILNTHLPDHLKPYLEEYQTLHDTFLEESITRLCESWQKQTFPSSSLESRPLQQDVSSRKVACALPSSENSSIETFTEDKFYAINWESSKSMALAPTTPSSVPTTGRTRPALEEPDRTFSRPGPSTLNSFPAVRELDTCDYIREVCGHELPDLPDWDPPTNIQLSSNWGPSPDCNIPMLHMPSSTEPPLFSAGLNMASKEQPGAQDPFALLNADAF